MKKQKQQTKQFGLPTAISMIIGIVIGSGIFFKTDDILAATGGNVLLGVCALTIGAISIIFGGLTLSALARKNDEVGGIITYAEIAFNQKFAFILGFFQLSAYYPTLIAIILFVAANYTLTLFPALPLNIWGVTLIYFLVMYSCNYASSKLSSIIQSSATIIKLFPLIVIGIVGILFGDPQAMQNDVVSLPLLFQSSAAIISVAFSYDGWIIATSIAHEIKDSKRNTPLALCIAPIIIMCVYLIYFVGMSSILSPEKIINSGDAHVSEVATMYFGNLGNKLILVAIIISVLGTVNGLILGGSRVPYSLAVRKELPFSNHIEKLDPKTQIPRNSLFLCGGLSLIWLLVHYASTKLSFLEKLDISSIPIVLMYGFFSIIYIKIIITHLKTKTNNTWYELICPSLATLGSATIIYGGVSSPMFLNYLFISLAILVVSVTIYNHNSKEINK
ncbi:MAG: APC family permease [Breznakia sp.]